MSPRGFGLVVRAQCLMCGLEACYGSEIFLWQKCGIYMEKGKGVDPLSIGFWTVHHWPSISLLYIWKKSSSQEMMKNLQWDVEIGQQRYLEVPLFMIILERSIIVLLDWKITNLLVVFPHPFVSAIN